MPIGLTPNWLILVSFGLLSSRKGQEASKIIILTENKVKEIIKKEIQPYLEALSKGMAEAICQNNRKIEQDLKDMGVIKK